MPGDLQCFECWLWAAHSAKCARHGTPADEAKRKAAADEGIRTLAATGKGNN